MTANRAIVLTALLAGFAFSSTTPAMAADSGCIGYANVIDSATFMVPAGEVRVFSEPTAIRAGIVMVAGALLTRDGDDAAAPGLCIEAEQVQVGAFGLLCTGNGADGPGQFGSRHSEGGDGTAGGDLTILLHDNPTTLTNPSLDVLGVICTGDGGHGGMAVVEACLPPVFGDGSAIPTCPQEPCSTCPDPCDFIGSQDGCLPTCEDCPEPCIPANLGDTSIPTCPSENPCAEACPDPCVPADLGDSGFPTCPEPNPCAEGCPEPCVPVDMGDAGVPTCPGEGPCADGCPEPCVPPGTLDAGIPECEQDPCAECQMPVDVCSLPLTRRAVGGDGGEAGLLEIHYTFPSALALAPASVKIGRGGDGGDALTFGGVRGTNIAQAGQAGASRLLVNGAAPTGGLLAAVGASLGGHGGDALAVPSNECDGNDPCQDSLWENRTYCLTRHYIMGLCIDEPHGGTFCDYADLLFGGLTGKALFGDDGIPDADAQSGPDPADPGYSAEDAAAGASWSASCGFSSAPGPPFGAYGCSASYACGASHPAGPGFYGEPGSSGAAAIAKATNGEYGFLKGGDGGAATATGAQGGDGGRGGNGGKGAQGCGNEHNGGPGGAGGRGGAGGQATAVAGNGGKSDWQGGKGGDAQATPGAGGRGGQGGQGGDPADECDAYTGKCPTYYPPPESGGGGEPITPHSWGGWWGCGGDGGGRAGVTSRPGDGGEPQNEAAVAGPKGEDIPVPLPAPYGPKGPNGTQYLAHPSCPV